MTNKEFIITTLKKHLPEISKYGIRHIGLFGSYARNEPSDSSDIDILLDFEPSMETYDNYLAIYDLLEQLFRDEKVEVVTKNGLSPYIGPQILNEVVYV